MTTPPSNTGVNKAKRLSEDERLVLEGGQLKVLCAERQMADRSGVIVDYLRCTLKRDALVSLEGMTAGSDDESLTMALAFRVAGVLGFTLGEARNGRDYYDHTWTVVNAFGREVGSVSGGGVSQRETFCVTLKGEGCTFARRGWEHALYSLLQGAAPKITRIDMARDFLLGELTIGEVVGCYETGAFDYRNRRPSYKQFGCWRGAESQQNSRTFQVGARDSGKTLRAYEKGQQFRMLNDPWLRVEVEMRNVNRVIPFEALIRPADFFAGAYEFCEWVLDNKPAPERIPTGKKVAASSVSRLMAWFERTVAPTLVHISAAAPDQSWLDEVIGLHIQRKAPRGIAGLDHASLIDGVSNYLKRFSAPAPAGCAL